MLSTCHAQNCLELGRTLSLPPSAPKQAALPYLDGHTSRSSIALPGAR